MEQESLNLLNNVIISIITYSVGYHFGKITGFNLAIHVSTKYGALLFKAKRLAELKGENFDKLPFSEVDKRIDSLLTQENPAE